MNNFATLNYNLKNSNSIGKEKNSYLEKKLLIDLKAEGSFKILKYFLIYSKKKEYL